MIPVLELCVHSVVARHLLPGRHLPSGSSEAEAGTGQTKQVSVDTGMLLETGYLSIPPPPPHHCPANPPDINTADTPITDGSPAPGSQWPVSPQPPRQCANMRGRSSGRGSYKGRGSSQTLAGRVETQTRGHGAVTRSRYTGCHRGRHRLLSHLKSGEVHVSVKMRRVVVLLL